MLDKKDILFFLKTEDSAAVQELVQNADKVRRTFVGDEVHLRAIVEISNRCVRNCLYCGLRRGHGALPRYRMDEKTILSLGRRVAELGFPTIVLQAGEDPSWSAEEIAGIIEKLRLQFGLTVTLSLGERSANDYKIWFAAGAQRYLLKHETSDPELYRRLHPDLAIENRLRCLENLKQIGFQVGSGIMIGLPGQTLESLSEDILLFKKMDIDMMGIGPFVPNPETPAPKLFGRFPFAHDPEELTYRVIALTRLVTQDTMIPATTALSTVNPHRGRALGLLCGANVIMPNATPPEFREKYAIYPKPAKTVQPIEIQLKKIRELLRSLNRTIATGPGHRPGRRAAVG